jgi:hypothetical protein
MALGPLQPFSPNATSMGASQLSSAGAGGFADAGAIGGASGAAGAAAATPGPPVATIIQKGLKLGLQVFQLVNTLDALKDQKAGIRDQAAHNRKVARDNAAAETFKIEITSFRNLKRITAQAAGGGFSTASQSTLKIKNQQQNDADRLEIQVNENLDNTMKEIQRIESEQLRANRDAKTGAITSFAGSIIGG